jgi:Glycosyltransferases involved in cell wall biogenesis
MSLISVITPAYNASAYIAETIESVKAQSFSNWEMIIVDDCSTDNTYDIAHSYAEIDTRIRVIKHIKNSGVAAARNTALEAAIGDYIAFLDSDDIWMPNKLEKQHSYMEVNGYALTYTMYQTFSSQNRTSGKIIKVPKNMTYKKIFGNTSIACLTVMVNRKMAGDFHMPLLQHTEDQCTWQDILSRGYKAYALQENLALYRESSVSLTGNKKKAIIKQWSTYRDYYKFSILKSGYYFICYAINAGIKHFY